MPEQTPDREALARRMLLDVADQLDRNRLPRSAANVREALALLPSSPAPGVEDGLRAENERLREALGDAATFLEGHADARDPGPVADNLRRAGERARAALAARSDADREPDPSPEPHQEAP